MAVKEIFLSASVPHRESGEFFDTADPFLIQLAVRELIVAVISSHNIVWGGHPAITPMISEICKDLRTDAREKVTLYQSRHFEGKFPAENENFANIVFTEDINGDRDRSLAYMREEMLSRDSLVAAVFIGGMKGIIDEYEMFYSKHSDSPTLAVAGPGGAAAKLAGSPGVILCDPTDLDFARFFRMIFSA